MQTALDRVGLYSKESKAKERKRIDGFIADMSKRKKRLTNSFTRLENSIDQIEKAISKSSPELGLDPQMEPMITSFVSSIEDSYNEINDYIAQIKEFETNLMSGDIEALLTSTDSVIAQLSDAFDKTKMRRSESKALSRAKKMQEEAHLALKKNKKKNAAKLSKEAYYSVIDLVPDVAAASDMETQYEELVDQLISSEEMLEQLSQDDVDVKKAKVFYNLAEEHLKKANAHKSNNEANATQKELDISSLLVKKLILAIVSSNKDVKKEKEL